MATWNMESGATITTTQLLDALRDPQQDAWSAIDARYRPIVERLARRFGLPAESAADIAQDTMARFAEAIRGGNYERARGRLRTYLVGIARHRIHDEMRARRQSPVARGQSALDTLPADEALTAAWDRELDRSILLTAFNRLQQESHAEERTMRAFELVSLRGLPAAAVAEACGLHTAEVYRIKHRLASRLRTVAEEVRRAFEDDA